jgi:hypothetical protein
MYFDISRALADYKLIYKPSDLPEPFMLRLQQAKAVS